MQKKTKNQGEIFCKMQRNLMVSPEWCQLAQYSKVCNGCGYSLARRESIYQKRNREELEK